MSHVERDLTRSVVARELWVAIEDAAYAAVSDPKNEGVPTSCLPDAWTERDLEPLNAAVRRPAPLGVSSSQQTSRPRRNNKSGKHSSRRIITAAITLQSVLRNARPARPS